MKNYRHIVLLLFLILAFSCSEPLNIDTARKKINTDPPRHIRPSITQVYFEENGVQENFSMAGSYIEIDTSKNPFVIWMYIALDCQPTASEISDKMTMGKIEFKLDSILITGTPFLANGIIDPRTWAKFNIFRGYAKSNTLADTTFFTGTDKSNLEISLANDQNNSQIWTLINSKIYDYRVWVDRRDTTIVDSVAAVRYDTTYDNGKQVIKEVHYKIPKSIKLTIEEEKRTRDSLFLYGKFLLKY